MPSLPVTSVPPPFRRAIALGPVLLALAGLAVLVGGVVFFARNEAGGDATHPERFVARVGSFDVTVPASGELAALKQTEIVNRLETRATITFIVDEGTSVSEGDVLLKLNDEEIRERAEDARDAVNTAETALVTAQSNLEIQRQSNASELAKADLAIRLSELALEAWEKGDLVANRRNLELELETAEKDFERLASRFEASQVLLEQEFISQDEYQRDEIEMIRARSRLDQAKLAIEVYESYTYFQERAKFESDLDQARDERDRIKQRHDNEIRRLESDVASRDYQLRSKSERLRKHEEQLEQCVITAPQDGLVVYASSIDSGRGWRNNEEVPQVGTELRRNQTVMILPDTSKMVAAVKVNEALSGKITPGQRASIVSDAVPDVAISGTVASVGVLAESGGWRDPNRRDYTVKIALEGVEGLGLKPSMRCKATIFVDRVEDALHVPIQSVFRAGPAAYVYVPDGSGFAQRRVETGRSSELYIELSGGLEPGEVVLLHEPATERITQQLALASRSGNAGPGAGNGDDRPAPKADAPRGRRSERSGAANGEGSGGERAGAGRGRG